MKTYFIEKDTDIIYMKEMGRLFVRCIKRVHKYEKRSKSINVTTSPNRLHWRMVSECNREHRHKLIPITREELEAQYFVEEL